MEGLALLIVLGFVAVAWNADEKRYEDEERHEKLMEKMDDLLIEQKSTQNQLLRCDLIQRLNQKCNQIGNPDIYESIKNEVMNCSNERVELLMNRIEEEV